MAGFPSLYFAFERTRYKYCSMSLSEPSRRLHTGINAHRLPRDHQVRQLTNRLISSLKPQLPESLVLQRAKFRLALNLARSKHLPLPSDSPVLKLLRTPYILHCLKLDEAVVGRVIAVELKGGSE